MANLPVIIRATQSSYRAITRMGQLSRQIRDAREPSEVTRLSLAFKRAERRFERAQATLHANPLPGDR